MLKPSLTDNDTIVVDHDHVGTVGADGIDAFKYNVTFTSDEFHTGGKNSLVGNNENELFSEAYTVNGLNTESPILHTVASPGHETPSNQD